MVAIRLAVAALTASTAYAASSSCSSSDTLSVQNQGDITSKIGGCSTFTGDIRIEAQSGATLDFGNVQKITGSVTMENDNLTTSLSFSKLTSLGSLDLYQLTALGSLNMASLQTVGNLSLVDLSALSTLTFGSLKQIGTVMLENIQTTDISGISSVNSIDNIVLSTNQFLSKIEFNLTKVNNVDISPNNYAQGQTISFPSLQTAASMSLRNATSISIPSLKSVSGTLGLYGNTFKSFGIANLTYVGGLVLQDNSAVTNFSFPKLTSINGSDSLDIENNTMYTNVTGFPVLATLSGGATIAGNIENVTFPKLSQVAGALEIDTTDSNFDCTPFSNLQGNVVAGAVNCKVADPTPTGSGGVETGGSGSSGSGTGGKSAGVPSALPSMMTTGIVAATLALVAYL